MASTLGASAMSASFRFHQLAATLSIIVLLCSASGIAISKAATPSGDSATALPHLTVDAPRQRANRHASVHRRPSLRSSTTSESCIDGCVSSFRSGDRPWVGCSVSGQYSYSTTCRNPSHFKNYNECREAGMKLGARDVEISWYCHSLAASNSYSDKQPHQ
jgi:hypothetical protein